MPHDYASIQNETEDRAEFAATQLETFVSPRNYGGVSGAIAISDQHGQHGIVISERCHYCSKARSPKDIIRLSGGTKMCYRCYQWHHHALDVLAGSIPRGCQECHLSFDELSRRYEDGNGDVRMSVIALEGIYAVVCIPCSNKIVRKRVDMFGETEFGHNLKLKGTK